MATEANDDVAALKHLKSMLLDGESLESYALQARITSLTHRRSGIGITNQRILGIIPKMIAGFETLQIRWQDIKDAHFSAGLFSAELKITALPSQDLASMNAFKNALTQALIDGATEMPGVTYVFSGYEKEPLQKIYRSCQSQVQVWREKRRVRDLEELRARSGGVQGGMVAMMSPQSAAPTGDVVAKLKQAKELLDAKILTDTEFEAMKAKILSGLM